MLHASMKSGFTFIELTVVMAIMSILSGIAIMNLTQLQNKTTLSTTINTFVSDIRQQQVKSMTGDTEGRATADSYGVHFDSNQYVLFHGTTYTPGTASNFVVPLNQNITFTSINVPSSNIIFNQISGDINGYTAGMNTVTIKNATTTEQKTVTFNRYGVITQIN